MGKLKFLEYNSKDLEKFHNNLKRMKISNTQLNFKEVSDVIFQPFLINKNSVNSVNRYVGGLFSDKGISIKDSFLIRGNKIIAGSNNVDSSKTKVKYLNSEFTYVYLGCIENHYGHFLMEVITRLYVVNYFNDLSKVKFIISGLDRLPSYALELLDIFGLKEANILNVTKQSFFKKVVIPDHSFIIRRYVNLNVFRFIREWIQQNINLEEKQDNSPVFISRAKFNNINSTVVGEKVLQNILFNEGYKIFHTQNMNVIDQIKMVNSYKSYLGFSGSALHNFIFAIRPVNLFQYCNESYPKFNFVLSDKANKNIVKSNYINSSFLNNKIDDVSLYTYKRAQVINVPKILEQLIKNKLFPNIKIKKKEIEHKIFLEYQDYIKDLSEFRTKNEMKKKIVNKWGDTLILGPRSFSKISYLTVLDSLHKYFNTDYMYFEIGTNKGNSIKLSKGHSVGVDPNFIVDQNIINKKQTLQLFQTTSTNFFDQYASTIFENQKINMAFIDGLHHSNQVFIDFVNTEKFSLENTIFIFHDVLPRTYETALKERETQSWTGDVWKTIWILYQERKDLDFIFIDAPPSGMLIVQYKSTPLKISSNLQMELLYKVAEVKDTQVYNYLEEIEVVNSNDYLLYLNNNKKLPKSENLKKIKLNVHNGVVKNN